MPPDNMKAEISYRSTNSSNAQYKEELDQNMALDVFYERHSKIKSTFAEGVDLYVNLPILPGFQPAAEILKEFMKPQPGMRGFMELLTLQMSISETL